MQKKANDYMLVCDYCKKRIELENIQLETQIVSKDMDYWLEGEEETHSKKVVAVRYYFNCPHCNHEFTCFYKDKETNELFDKGLEEEAQQRMIMLWEFFENG